MNEAAKRTALRKISYGLYVIGVRDGDNINAFTGDWMSQCSFAPPLVMMAVRNESGSNVMIRKSGVFAVSVLGREQQDTAKHFFKPERISQGNGKLDGFDLVEGTTGAPILRDCAAWFECRIRDIIETGGDHTVIIAEVIEAGVESDNEPLRLSDTPWHYGG
jgi:flavin reductase (DIM6/NTAB) family NADH-FMN oxidoreductase RutF